MSALPVLIYSVKTGVLLCFPLISPLCTLIFFVLFHSLSPICLPHVLVNFGLICFLLSPSPAPAFFLQNESLYSHTGLCGHTEYKAKFKQKENLMRATFGNENISLLCIYINSVTVGGKYFPYV